MNPSEHAHIVSSFYTELSQLERRVLEMGGLAEAQLAAALEALQKRDAEAAERIIGRDPSIDEAEQKIEASALSILARRQPMANDLRYVFGTVKIAGSLERIGDYAKNIAKRTIVLAKYPNVPTPPEAAPLAAHALTLLREVMDSFTTRDARKAESVWRRDQEVDDLASRMQRGVIFRMSSQLTEGGHEAGEVECSTHFCSSRKTSSGWGTIPPTSPRSSSSSSPAPGCASGPRAAITPLSRRFRTTSETHDSPGSGRA
jgi:phosphate transport system protein